MQRTLWTQNFMMINCDFPGNRAHDKMQLLPSGTLLNPTA
jgi:hypothetical protein